MIGDIEERIQVYEDAAHEEEIITRRRYVSASQAAALLTGAGFERLEVTTEYAVDGFRTLRQAETLESPFVCVARKALQVQPQARAA